jgi:AcrR family transcriptional regulator
MPVPLDTTRPDGRRRDILDQAAHLFGARGYAHTSMRDIAAAVGIMPGSVYYHFPSKEALLAAVHAEAIDHAIATISTAIAPYTDPWDRMEAAAIAHLNLLLTSGTLAAVVAEGRGRNMLVHERDRYEAVFRDLVAGVTLPPSVQAGPFRLALLGALNWALTWYRPDGNPPEVVARDLFAIFRANSLPVQGPGTTP